LQGNFVKVMQFNLKSYLKLSFLYTLASSFPVILQIVILPLIEGNNLLGAVDFSKIAISESISNLVGTFILFSMSGAVSRFYYDYLDDPKRMNHLLSSILTGILARGVIVLGIGILLGNRIAELFNQPELQDFSTYGYGAIIIGINRSILITMVTLFRNQRKVMRFVVINIIVASLRTAGQLIGVFFYEMTFVGYINGGAIGGGIMTVFLLIYVYKTTGIRYSYASMRPIYQFAAPLFVFELVRWGVLFSDRLFLEKFPVELGIYDTAQRFAFGIYYLFQGLYGAIQPDFFLYLTRGIEQTAEDIRRLSNTYMLQAQIVVLSLILPVMGYITFFFETDLTKASSLITLVFCQYIINGMNTLLALPIIYQKKTKQYLWIQIFTLMISLTLNVVLIPVFTYYGAITSAYIANLTQFILILVFQKRLIAIPYNYQKIVQIPIIILGLAVGVEILKHLLDIDPFWAALGFVTVSFGILTAVYRKILRELVSRILLRR